MDLNNGEPGNRPTCLLEYLFIKQDILYISGVPPSLHLGKHSDGWGIGKEGEAQGVGGVPREMTSSLSAAM